MAKRKRRNFIREFKAELVLEALSGEVPRQNCVAAITSAQINPQSGSSYSLKTQRLCLDQGIKFPSRTPWNALHTLNSLLGS